MMSRKHFVISGGLVALLWTAVYVVAVMWVIGGEPIDAGGRAIIIVLGATCVAFLTWPTMVVIRWIEADPGNDPKMTYIKPFTHSSFHGTTVLARDGRRWCDTCDNGRALISSHTCSCGRGG